MLTVEDVGFGGFGMTVFDENLLNQILNILNGWDASVFVDDFKNPDDLTANSSDLASPTSTIATIFFANNNR